MIAGCGITDKGAVHRGGSCENFASRQVGPITWADEAAGFYPVEAAIEMGSNRGACFGFYGERLRAEHAFTEFVAQAVHHTVIGAHALLHNFRSYADHVGVADSAAFDDADDGHARAEFAGLRRHAHRA